LNGKTWVEIKPPALVRGEQLGVARSQVFLVMDCPVQQGRVQVQIVSNKHDILAGSDVLNIPRHSRQPADQPLGEKSR